MGILLCQCIDGIKCNNGKFIQQKGQELKNYMKNCQIIKVRFNLSKNLFLISDLEEKNVTIYDAN